MTAPVVIAQYHGTCAECDKDIVPGQVITPDGDEWLHATCGARPDEAPCVCERCWLVHAPQQEVCF